uniref:Odorant-binding protein 23 n=1 Tax=Monochamus alternatus TaxID=192382 RepID=A0A1I9HZM6_MONAT|nr:odorant-binding protein 23 [Monochamus alternatus]
MFQEFGPKIQSIAGPVHSRCVFRTGIPQYYIDNVINGIFIDEPLIKSYMTCIFKESRLMFENGELNYDLGAYLLPEDIKDEAISNAKYCEVEAKGIKNVQDRLFQMLKCYYGLDPDIFIFF